MKKKTIKQKNKTSKVKDKSVLKVTDIYGAELWYKGDKLHREDGPAITYADGRQKWYKNGVLIKPGKNKDKSVHKVSADGSKLCYKEDGLLHRKDGPAVIYHNGNQAWYKEGKIHRDDGPAVIYPNGEQFWYKEGKHHREGGPAIIRPNGEQVWYKEGKLHREDGPAVINDYGEQYWYKNGTIHRDDGPAATYADGSQYWYKEGKLHREDGPAVLFDDGTQEWYKDGVKYNPPTPAKAAPAIKNTNTVSYIDTVPEAKGTSEFDKGWNAALASVRSLYK